MILSSLIHNQMDFVNCGAKAYHLAGLLQAGFCVPSFICISIEALKIPDDIFAALEQTGVSEPYVVRSSAAVEDSEKESYAGQFTTFLNVEHAMLLARVKECFTESSRFSYFNTANNHAVQYVIIQELVDADLSGVMFTKNPMGILSESVIVVGQGLGSNVVADKVPVTSYYYNAPDDITYQFSQEGAPKLSSALQTELYEAGKQLEEIFCKGLDVEFAIKNDKLYFLQVRKITTLSYDNPLILDNSNIVESYPGTTCPLTADFVAKQYTAIFKGVITHLSGSSKLSKQYALNFDHMVEHYNGRMYYHIINWYGVISFLPFSKKILPVWQEMLGVAHDDKLPTTYKISGLQRTAIAFHTLYYLFKAPQKMQELQAYMDKAEASYLEITKKKRNMGELKAFYESTVALIMDKWDYTLINDMYTFIYTGLFRSEMKKRGTKQEELQKAITDMGYLASIQPVKTLLALSMELKNNGKSDIFTVSFNDYIEKFGDRSIGELKLETDTYRERPKLLLKQLEQYAALPNLEELYQALEQSTDKNEIKGLAGFFLKRAKLGIEGREKSRLDRTRLFGYARAIFLQAGELLKEQERISSPRDVFYLTINEVFHSERKCYHSIVSGRQQMMDSYLSYPAFSRVIFDGKIVQKPYMGKMKIYENAPKALAGIPCSSGKAKARVLRVASLEDAIDFTGKILVTHSTDPGWAFLLASAAGLISEKGSLLSHTAIIARELKVPMIVAVNGATSQLHNDDEIEMDCATGFIRILSKSRDNGQTLI